VCRLSELRAEIAYKDRKIAEYKMELRKVSERISNAHERMLSVVCACGNDHVSAGGCAHVTRVAKHTAIADGYIESSYCRFDE
jgi:hypothetical protein